jgi:hypothetical protein
MTFWPKKNALIRGYRSGLELKIARQLEQLGVPFEYEAHPLVYEIPARNAKYRVDFILPNGILIETKGRFISEDRKKHKLIKEQFPDLDLRIVFSNPNSRIGKKSKTTYGMWCDSLGIPYAAKEIPIAWIEEKPTRQRLAALRSALGK